VPTVRVSGDLFEPLDQRRSSPKSSRACRAVDDAAPGDRSSLSHKEADFAIGVPGVAASGQRVPAASARWRSYPLHSVRVKTVEQLKLPKG